MNIQKRVNFSLKFSVVGDILPKIFRGYFFSAAPRTLRKIGLTSPS